MLALILYILIITFEIVFLIGFIVFVTFLIYSSIKGAPYVPTHSKEADTILKEADLKKGQYFIELGSGDGRLVRKAAKTYGVHAVGVDINPTLIWYSKFLSFVESVRNTSFIREDLFKTRLNNADVVYLFLMPELLEKLTPTLKKDLKKGALVISHGFALPHLKKNLQKTIPHSPFPTYFYRI